MTPEKALKKVLPKQGFTTGRQGLIVADGFDRSIRFPKQKDTAYGYEEVLKKHDQTVIDSYNLVETDTELYLTEQVNNILFERHS